MAEGAWRNVILETIRQTPPDKEKKPGEGYGTWVVARVKPDNTLFGVTFRSGKYYPNKVTGEMELPKDGISYYDFMELKKLWKGGPETVWDLAVKLLDPRHPPVIPNPGTPPPSAPQDPADDRPPWER